IRATRWLAMTGKFSPFVIPGWSAGPDLSPSGKIYAPVGWVEPCAKPITAVQNMMGIASLHPSYALRAGRFRHCEERRDEAIHTCFAERWIASLALAMTGIESQRPSPPHQPIGEIADGLAIDRRPIPFAHRLEVRSAFAVGRAGP